MTDDKTRCTLTSTAGPRGALAFVIVLIAPLALTAAAFFYYHLASQASTAGGFALWDMFRLSVHDIRPNAEYRFIGLHLIAREYLYQSVFFAFFAAIAGLGAAHHGILRVRNRRIVALLEKNGLF